MKNNLKRCIAIMMAVTLAVGCLPGNLQRKFGAQPEVKAEETINDPRIVADDSMKAGQKVTWDCVWFGTYPQTEIVDKAETCGTYGNKSWGNSADYEVNASTYSALQNASGWNSNGDITLSDGKKYHRIKRADATYETSGSSGHYNWAESDIYHYFRYDPIKWRVLDADGSTALLLADKALDAQKYNTVSTVSESVTWETSTIRSWLNGYGASSNKQSMDYRSKNFIDSAFTTAQQGGILTSNLTNADNISYGIKGGNGTSDKVFLLSESEVYTDAAKSHGFASSYNTYDEARRSKSSTYAKAMGTFSKYASSYNGNCDWWLRSPGWNVLAAANMDYDGTVNPDGLGFDYNRYGVRPALRLNLASSNLYTYAGTVCSDGTDTEVGGGSGSGGEDEETYTVTYDANGGSGAPAQQTINAGENFTISSTKPTRNGYAFLGWGKTADATSVYQPGMNIAVSANMTLYAIWRSTTIEETVSLNNGSLDISYSDDYFAKNSNIYNHSLARFCSALSLVAYSSNAKRKDALAKLGFRTDSRYYTHLVPNSETTGNEENYSITQKQIYIDGTEKTLVLCMVDGTQGREWMTNFMPGYGETHQSWTSSKNFVMSGLKSYIKKYDLKDDNLKLLITGHSRGAAVGNLLAAEIDKQGLFTSRENVFTYTFATPKTTRASGTDNSMYNNIFNIVNPEDFVTKVLPGDWNFKRYGITYSLPSKTNSSKLFKKYINDVQDYFHKYNSKLFYDSYIGGELETYMVVKYLTSIRFNQQMFNDNFIDTARAPFSFKTFFSRGLTPWLASDAFSKAELSYSIGLLASSITTHITLPITAYFVAGELLGHFNQGDDKVIINDNFTDAHSCETYTAYMMLLSGSELKSEKKTILGSVNCPVDVLVYDSDHNLVGRIKDNKVDTSLGNEVAMAVDGDSKTFMIPSDANYNVVLEGNDEGKMDMSITADSTISGSFRENYYDIPVEDNERWSVDFAPEHAVSHYFEITEEESGSIERPSLSALNPDPINVEVEVNGCGTATSLDNVIPGDYVTLFAQPKGDNEFIGWYQENELISTEKEYSFVAKTNMKLIAKFTNHIVHTTGINLNENSINMGLGDYHYLEATPIPSNTTDDPIIYESLNENIVTVESGLLYAKANGKADIKVTSGSISVICSVIVGEANSYNPAQEETTTKIKVSKITLTGISKKIARGRKIKLTATVLPKNATNKKLKWTTSNKKLATVTQTGLVKIAKKAKPGKTVKITAAATDGSGKKQVWAIKVMKGAVKKITVKGYKKTLKAGKTMKLKAVVKTTKGKPVNKKLKWTSLSPQYATVAQTGKVKAKTAGKGKTVKIKVESTDGTNKSVVKKIKIK